MFGLFKKENKYFTKTLQDRAYENLNDYFEEFIDKNKAYSKSLEKEVTFKVTFWALSKNKEKLKNELFKAGHKSECAFKTISNDEVICNIWLTSFKPDKSNYDYFGKQLISIGIKTDSRVGCYGDLFEDNSHNINARLQYVVSELPRKEEVLSNKNLRHDNFFPLAILNVDNNVIPIMLTYIDVDLQFEDGYNEDEDGTSFSLHLNNYNKCEITFDEALLNIPDDNREIFEETLNEYRALNNIADKLYFPLKPIWYHNDQTPLDKEGRSLKFICQYGGLINIPAEVFVFYNEQERKVKYIYQFE